MGTVTVKGKQTYVVEQLVGENPKFNIYRASSVACPSQQFFLKIARTVAQNGLLDREAYLLKLMGERAEMLEREYALMTNGRGLLNFKVGFPQLVETFFDPDQGDRRILVTSLMNTDAISDFASLSMVRERDYARVDPKTSAWILGKTLKILLFANSQNITVGDLSDENILIEREHHLVTIFDWSTASIHHGGISPSVMHKEIRSVVGEVVRILGGDVASGKIPDDEQLIDARYQEIISSLLRGAWSDIKQAHTEFYKVVEALWGRKFHPYTTYPLIETEKE